MLFFFWMVIKLKQKYLPRIVDKQIEKYLNFMGAVVIKGPKWCGKTTSASQIAKSIVKFQDENQRANYDKIMSIIPNQILKGDTPRLIDEWQVYPVVWNCVRNEVDERGEVGQFILTGSTTPVDDKNLHTGTGRIARIVMRPMSLFESLESNGKISLKEIFENPNLNINGIESDLEFEDLIFAACRGGWPSSLNLKSNDSKLLVAKEYFKALCEEDISKVDNISKNSNRAKLILRSYARNISTMTSNTTILNDIRNNDSDLSESTLYSYLNSLNRLYVLEDVEAWQPAIRSKTAIRACNKKEFVDPSIAVAALDLTPDLLINDLNTFGFIFENLCIRDLRIYSSGVDASISYYHDRYDLEADCVIHLGNGKYGLIEIKLGDKYIDEGASHLLEIKRLIEKHNFEEPNSKIRVPDVLMVITGSKYAYRRDDGVLVVPIGCLKD